MRRLYTSLVLFLLTPTATLAADPYITPDPSTNTCPTGSLPGVLTACTQPSFDQYLEAIFHQLIPYVLTLAMILIVASGVQYMTSGLSPDGAKKAKERIIGILTGVVFFFFINFIISNLQDGLHL